MKGFRGDIVVVVGKGWISIVVAILLFGRRLGFSYLCYSIVVCTGVISSRDGREHDAVLMKVFKLSII